MKDKEIHQIREVREYDRLCQETESLYHNISAKMGLSDSSSQILYSMVELGDGCLQTDISKWYSCSKQTISSSVKVLEKKGLLRLEPGKGRDMHLHLTEEGQKLIEKTIYPMIDMENRVFFSMPLEERQEFLRLMRKYVKILKEQSENLINKIEQDKKEGIT